MEFISNDRTNNKLNYGLQKKKNIYIGIYMISFCLTYLYFNNIIHIIIIILIWVFLIFLGTI